VTPFLFFGRTYWLAGAKVVMWFSDSQMYLLSTAGSALKRAIGWLTMSAAGTGHGSTACGSAGGDFCLETCWPWQVTSTRCVIHLLRTAPVDRRLRMVKRKTFLARHCLNERVWSVPEPPRPVESGLLS
jgi:hypothetical protein